MKRGHAGVGWEEPARRTRPENIGAPEPVVKFGLDTAGNSDWLPPLRRMSTRGRISLFGVL